jgi:MFS family permease
MTPLAGAWRDFRDAARLFSRPARLYLGAEFLMWTAHGIFSVLFNLYLVEAGASEAFVGSAISASALGMVVAALPAGTLADRWGRRRTLMLGAVLEGVGHLLRASTTHGPLVLGAGLVAGLGQSLFQIAAAPFLTDHSTPRERTHLFSMFFASALLAGVFGNAVGGALPSLVRAVAPGVSLFAAYRVALFAGALCAASAALPLLALSGLVEPKPVAGAAPPAPHETRRLLPIAINAALIGSGAGLVIPFMNLYFKNRFACSSGQIGTFFSIAQVFTALAALAAPAVARRFGKLRTAVASELLSLPFLVTLGGERHLGVAVGAFWLRATFMQASTPLLQAFVMEVLPHELRARSTSLNNMVWNLGWAVSATLAGVIIEHFGYAVPFYLTATLYLTAALTFYRAFRGTSETPAAELRLSEEAKGLRGDGPGTE